MDSLYGQADLTDTEIRLSRLRLLVERQIKGQRLNELRVRTWITVPQLAAVIGVETTKLRDIEFGLAELTPELERKILRVLGVPRL